MKRIYLEPAWKIRKTPYFEAYLQEPPNGYQFIIAQGVQNGTITFLSKFGVSFAIQSYLVRLLPIQLIKSFLERFKRPPKQTVLTYALEHVVVRNEPWVLEITFELPWIICGSFFQQKIYTAVLRNLLCSPNLKAILFQLETGRLAFLNEFGHDLEAKTAVICRAETPKLLKKIAHQKIRLLFVNSCNVSNLRSFYMKGGLEVISAFCVLQKKYGDRIELVVRTILPKLIKAQLVICSNVRVLDQTISSEELKQEWLTADIFIHPHYGNMSHTLIEALSYGIPVVTTDTWATSELIDNGKTGFLVHNPRAQRYTSGALFFLSDPNYLKEIMSGPDPSIVTSLVEKISLLVDNKELRQSMGIAALAEVSTGKFAMNSRNRKLKEVLDKLGDSTV